ncbi:hypothetical protein [Methanolapillus millepedarum]|uniref:Uncharacterized protein n=1 Tax=Methanolapillus millepedarum TaxID=3028296 RepID=A0AA96VDB5_9EURY|nr:hypothetical protein MsAc7_17490 [Methanosarcinaceae archaeon Ac7]
MTLKTIFETIFSFLKTDFIPIPIGNPENGFSSYPKQEKQIYWTKTEMINFLRRELKCDDIVVNDQYKMLVDKKWFMAQAETFGVKELVYKSDINFAEEIAKIESSGKSGEEKDATIKELKAKKNFDCEDFATLFKGRAGELDGFLAVGKVEGSRQDKNGVSAHAFDYIVTTEEEILFIEPQTNGTWGLKTNTWIPYRTEM